MTKYFNPIFIIRQKINREFIIDCDNFLFKDFFYQFQILFFQRKSIKNQ